MSFYTDIFKINDLLPMCGANNYGEVIATCDYLWARHGKINTSKTHRYFFMVKVDTVYLYLKDAKGVPFSFKLRHIAQRMGHVKKKRPQSAHK